MCIQCAPPDRRFSASDTLPNHRSSIFWPGLQIHSEQTVTVLLAANFCLLSQPLHSSLTPYPRSMLPMLLFLLASALACLGLASARHWHALSPSQHASVHKNGSIALSASAFHPSLDNSRSTSSMPHASSPVGNQRYTAILLGLQPPTFLILLSSACLIGHAQLQQRVHLNIMQGTSAKHLTAAAGGAASSGAAHNAGRSASGVPNALHQQHLTPAQQATQAAITAPATHQDGKVPVRTGLAWAALGGSAPPPPAPPGQPVAPLGAPIKKAATPV